MNLHSGRRHGWSLGVPIHARDEAALGQWGGGGGMLDGRAQERRPGM